MWSFSRRPNSKPIIEQTHQPRPYRPINSRSHQRQEIKGRSHDLSQMKADFTKQNGRTKMQILRSTTSNSHVNSMSWVTTPAKFTWLPTMSNVSLFNEDDKKYCRTTCVSRMALQQWPTLAVAKYRKIHTTSYVFCKCRPIRWFLNVCTIAH